MLYMIYTIKDPNCFYKPYYDILPNNVTNFPCKGDFQFQYSNILGQTRSFKYTLDKSWEGHMVIFPSQLIHQVYPFYNCDEERISVSGNILVNTSKRL